MATVTYDELGRPNVAKTIPVDGIGDIQVVQSDIDLANEHNGEVGWIVDESENLNPHRRRHTLGRCFPTYGVELGRDQTVSWDDFDRAEQPCERAIANKGWAQLSQRDVKQAQASNGDLTWRLIERGGAGERRVVYALAPSRN